MKTKNSNALLITSLLFMLIMGLLSIYSASFLSGIDNLHIKQATTIIISTIIIIITLFIGNERIINYSKYFYITSIILLILTYFFGTTINGAKCWLQIGPLTFQPSEFMKIALIIELAKIIETYHFKNTKNLKEELKLIGKVLILTIIPCFLVFIEPDTGAVIIYLLIALSMLFISPLRNRWLIIFITLLITIITSLVLFYIYYPNIFVNTFGTSIFYRIDRIINWHNNLGMQLENSLISIGTGGLKGLGLTNTPIYIPESHTDFIFSVFANNFGLIGSISLILVITIFNIKIIDKINHTTKTIEKYIYTGFLTTLLFSQIQNIAMTLGLLPIMGIPLTFISYGGSNLITYMFFIALLLNGNKISKTMSKKLKKKQVATIIKT